MAGHIFIFIMFVPSLRCSFGAGLRPAQSTRRVPVGMVGVVVGGSGRVVVVLVVDKAIGYNGMC